MNIIVKNAKIPNHANLTDILMVNGKIVAKGENLEKPSFGETQVIDAKGKKVIPGLIDQHVHITGGGGEGGFTTRVPALKYTTCVKNGVTTIVGLLGTDGTTRTIRDLVATAKSLTEQGITTYCLTGSYEFPSVTLTGNSEDDIVFINEVIGCKLAIADHRSSYQPVQNLIDVAAKMRIGGLLSGKPGIVTLHVGIGKNAFAHIFEALEKTDLPITVFRPTHIQKNLDSAIKFAKMGGYIDFTSNPNPAPVAEAIITALESGVPPHLITVSSDANGSRPIWNENKEMCGIGAASFDTLHLLIKELTVQGAAFDDAISYFTSNVAKALNLYPKKGALEVNSDGDLLILDEDLSVNTVIIGGKLCLYNNKLLVNDIFSNM